MRRCSALPFVKKDDYDDVFVLFDERADDLETDRLKDFSNEMITYLNDQWRNGTMAEQDWNLYDINLMMVPSTNNGNEGQNSRFKDNFGIHPKIWEFFLTLDDELQSVSVDIPAKLFGSLVPKPDNRYRLLKEEREIAKANYEAGLLSLDQYLGRMGALSLHAGKAKVNSDDEPQRKQKSVDSTAAPTTRKRTRTEPARVGQRGRPVVRSISESSNDVPISLTLTFNLPWPAPSASSTSTTSYMPSTACRMATSAQPSSRVQPMSSSVLPRINHAAAQSSNDSLVNHIAKYNLGLRLRPDIPGDGNCWYSANVDLITLFKLRAPTDHLTLRKAVANSMLIHPQKRNWIQSLFGGKTRDFNKYVRDQSKPGVFIDNTGIPFVATADYLNVVYHLVGTSNNAQNPVTVIGEGQDRKIFHMGYYQDNTDRNVSTNSLHKAGHYQSLEIIPDTNVPCCHLSVLHNVSRAAIQSSVVEGIKAEEKILNVLGDDERIVESCLKRLLDIKNISVEELFRTNIYNLLTTKIKPMYPASSQPGKQCRRLLNQYQRLCRNHPDFHDEVLPVISDISDDSDSPLSPATPVRTFRSLFTGEMQETRSSMLSMVPNTVTENSIGDNGPASSTLIESQDNQRLDKNNLLRRMIDSQVSVDRSSPHTTSTNEYHNPCQISKRYNKIISSEESSGESVDSDEPTNRSRHNVELTPPPWYSDSVVARLPKPVNCHKAKGIFNFYDCCDRNLL